MSRWVIYCTGASIRDKIEKLKEYFKDEPNTIAVNSAVLDFPSTYWCFLDSKTFYGSECARDRKVVTSRMCASQINRKFKGYKFHEIVDAVSSNSGIFAIQYALRCGASQIITCGFELTDDWAHYNGTSGNPNSSYARLMRESFKRFHKNHFNICSVDEHNPLGLRFYDINVS